MSGRLVMIRPPRAGDGDGLARCWLDAGAYYAALAPELFQVPDAKGLAAWLEEQVLGSTSSDVCSLVAEHDGQVVGAAYAVIRRPVPDAAKQLVREVGQTRAEVNVLIVREECRRQGIGTRLMDAVEEWARSQGVRLVLLNTYIESPLSVPFYEHRMGYRRQALRFRKDLR